MAAAESLIHVVVDLGGAFWRCQGASVSPGPNGQIQGVDSDGQLTSVANPDRYGPRARLPTLLLGCAYPSADLAHLGPEPILAQSAELDEGKGESEAS